MHAVYGEHTPGPLPLSYPHDAFLDDVSHQMAVSKASRRLSRGSTGQRSGSMRVVKPSSASNSPRSSTMASRRRTMINDPQMQRRSQQIMDYLSTTPRSNDISQPAQRPARPVSWHPSTYLQPPQPQYQQQYQQPTNANMYDQHESYFSQPHFSPMMASYSNDTSPSSTFSPLPLGYPAPEASQYTGTDGWELSQRSAQNYSGANDYRNTTEMFPSLNAPREQQVPPAGSLDWNSFIMHGFNNTSPPTPEAFLQPQQNQPAVSEDAVPYQPLDDAEEEGEILVGMGLYDAPDKCEEDPQLNNYRTTVSSLLGSTFRPSEPKGKGLKLEETWEPPKSDDEDEDGESSDSESNAGDEIAA